ncbi:MAG: hypothetical protein D6690_10340 [Nitrospirae bacterium]|nr:MAG: hypothetical protein D6690_10340 [Nitrospirota bacterium]
MDHSSSALPGCAPNTLWLTLVDHTPPLIIRSQLLGLTPDRALLCALPQECDLALFVPGTRCKLRALFEGETYQFETTIRQTIARQSHILLHEPAHIEPHHSRGYPRLRVHIPGILRPIREEGEILAVLPVMVTNLCPTGCQLTLQSETWPSISSLSVFLSCTLPGLAHRSKIPGTIEWIDAAPVLRLGIQFQFSPAHEPAWQDLHRWFTSQQAQLINTVI